MKFLLEKSIINREEELKFLTLSDRKKEKYLKKNLKDIFPNYNYIKDGEYWIIDNIIKKGLDDEENPFLIYLNKINTPISKEILHLIEALITNNSLDPDKSWLYKKAVYNYTDPIFLIKALTYATNPDLQTHSDKQITEKDFMDNRGRFRSINSIKKLLNSINIEDTLYIRDILKEKDNLKQLKELIKIINDSKLSNNQKDDLIYTLQNTFKDNYDLIMNTKIIRQNPDNISKVLFNLLNTKEKDKSQEQNKSSKDDFKGEKILKDYLGNINLSWKDLRNHLINIFEGDPNKVTAQAVINDDQAFNTVQDEIRDVLASTIKPALDDKPIELLNNKLKQVINSSIKGTK